MADGNGAPPQEGLGFLRRCLEARSSFDTWVISCTEQEIKAHFSRFAAILRGLDEIIEEAERIVRQDPFKKL